MPVAMKEIQEQTFQAYLNWLRCENCLGFSAAPQTSRLLNNEIQTLGLKVGTAMT